MRIRGYGREFSEKCLICTMRTASHTGSLHCNYVETHLQPSTTPLVLLWLGPLFPPRRLLLTWIFSSHSSSGTFRKPRMAVLSFAAVSQSCGAWSNPDTIATPSLASSSCTAGHQGCPRGQTPASSGFPTYPQKEVEQLGHRVRKAAGLSLGDLGFSIAQETLGKGI